jgi:AcrR family transcriptional regulator
MSLTVGLRERKKLRTSSTIAQVTLDLVQERGFDAVRIEDICEIAEVSRSTFFRYFDSKEASYVAGLHEGRREAIIEAVRRRPSDEPPLTALQNAFIDVSADWRDRRDLWVLDASIRAASPAVEARANSEYLTWEIAMATEIEDRIMGGSSREVSARVIAAVANCAVRLANEQWLADGARRPPAPFFRRVFGAAQRALAPSVGGAAVARD